MKTIGLYPGCSLSGTANEYARSLRAIAPRLGYELKEVPDWLCCGASSAHALDHDAALCMAADTLAKACHAGMDQVLAPCAMCYQRLAVAGYEFAAHRGMAARVAKALGEPADLPLGQVRTLSLMNWLAAIPEEEIKAAITKPLTGLKVACYYGCLLVRPPKVTGETDVEMPRSMEKIVRIAGAEAVRWSMAMECCGGSFALSRKQVVLRQGQRICESARKAGADLIVLACPMCQANLDMRQSEFAKDGVLPVLYLTQLLGLALGVPWAKLGLSDHFVPVAPALSALRV